jgi:hypothetical protein
MHPSSRHPNGSPRAVLRASAATLAAAALAAAALAGAGPAFASAHPSHAARTSHAAPRSRATGKSRPPQISHNGWVKYFIVAAPTHGAKEFLFEIAASTLGRGSLANEIFNLNKGRLQPDGGRLENPTVIRPGWILVLPSSAHGPGVHFGLLPVVKPVPSPSPSPSKPPRPAPVRHRHATTPPARPGQRVMVAWIGGALVVALLPVIGLLLMRRRKSRNRAHRPDPVRPSEGAPGGGRTRRARPGGGTGRRGGLGSRRRERQADPGPAMPLPLPLPQATVLAGDPAPPPGQPAPDALAGAGQPALPGPTATPAWLALPALEDVDAASPAMAARPGPGVPDGPDHEDVAWPDFLGPADSQAVAQGQAVPGLPVPDLPGPDVPGPDVPAPVSLAPDVADAPADVPPWLAHDSVPPWLVHDSGVQVTEPSPAEPAPRQQQPETGFSPVALRLLGAQRSAAQRAGDADIPVQRHTIGFGEDQIEIKLAEAPAADQDGRPRGGHTWLADAPYLVWTPLPYDAPDGGTAFACLGVGDEGCLFIDLAAAPGAVAIGGERAAATRLAESIVHQLGMSPVSGHSRLVIVAGAVVPEPHPAAVLSLPSLGDLASVSGTGASDAIEIVFSELRSDEDAFALARYVASNSRRVVPVVLADLPDAPWSLLARPSQQPGDVPDPARSSDALDPASA